MNQPTNFLGQNPLSSRHPPQVGISRMEEARAVYVTRMAPRLSVRPDGLVCLNAEAARLLPPGDGTIDLRPPIRDRDAWHLDCRPGGHYRRLPVGQSGGIRFKAAARTNVMLGVAAEPLHFGLEHVGNGLFRLYTETVNK
jgi:hypothetical protein